MVSGDHPNVVALVENSGVYTYTQKSTPLKSTYPKKHVYLKGVYI